MNKQMSLSETVGKNIRAFRDKLGLTQDQVAAFLGIDRSSVSYYENGEREISLVHLNKLSDLFGVELEDLAESDLSHSKANLAFAFRSDGAEPEDVLSIAAFQKVVKNYIGMSKISQ